MHIWVYLTAIDSSSGNVQVLWESLFFGVKTCVLSGKRIAGQGGGTAILFHVLLFVDIFAFFLGLPLPLLVLLALQNRLPQLHHQKRKPLSFC